MPSHLGRYQLLRPIGRGGMAEVWLARHRGAGGVEKRVVVKRILRERSRDPRFLDLFVSEAQISMALTHKNIVPTFDFGRVGDELFLVMEYIEGTNLAQAMRAAKQRNLPPSAPLVCHIAFEACQALEYAHGYKDTTGALQRIAHRDVTPANLLLSASGEVKLSDFGLAQATEEHAKAEGRTRGTPRYMAPEQALGGVIGPAADIFALGLVLRDCLVFDVLRKGSQEDQLRAAKASVPALPKTIPEDMRAICERATQFDPSKRYASAKAMSEDLDRALLHARMAETNDRRPMPERLAAWVASVEVKKDTAKAISTSDPRGETVTYLDDGANEVLAGLGDSTLRSMAATGMEGDSDDASPGEPESHGADLPSDHAVISSTSHQPWLVIFALIAVSLGGLVFSLLGSEEHQEPSSDAMAFQPSIIDAAGSDERLIPPTDASPLAHDAQPISIDAKARRVTRPKTPSLSTKALGTLRVSSAPWATVRVTGRADRCDETPCELHLPQGTHTLELRNPVAGLRKSVRVTVKANQVVKIHEVLEASPRQ